MTCLGRSHSTTLSYKDLHYTIITTLVHVSLVLHQPFSRENLLIELRRAVVQSISRSHGSIGGTIVEVMMLTVFSVRLIHGRQISRIDPRGMPAFNVDVVWTNLSYRLPETILNRCICS